MAVKSLSAGLLSLILLSIALGTQVSGPVSGSWTTAGNPYEVIGNVYINSGQVLEIEPGVEVIFNGQYSFVINSNAELTAQGTETDSIRFTAQNPNVHWLYLNFLQSSNNSILEYCLIEYGGSINATTGFGAVTIDGCNITVSNCEVANNSSTWGGGIYCRNGASPTIENCNVHHNTASSTGGGIGCSMDANPYIFNCEIHDNTASKWGGGIYVYSASNPTIEDCNIYTNTAENSTSDYGGGGIYFATGTDGTITSCNIYDNHALNNGLGGGICTYNSTVIIYETIIANNTAAGEGGGIGINRTVNTDSTLLYDCNIYGNTASTLGGGISDNNVSYPYQTMAINSVVWNNTAPSSPQYAGTFRMHYSDVNQTTQGVGNIMSDPLFVDPGNMNFDLQAASPCIDAGNPDTTYNDPDGTIGDIGVMFFPQNISIALAPDTIVFDSTAISEIDTSEFYIINLLNETVLVDSVASSSELFTVPDTSFYIAPSDSASIPAYFQPIGGGMVYGEISGYSRGLTDNIICSGYGEGGFYVNPASIDFGNTLLGDTSVHSAWAINMTGAEIAIDSVISDNPLYTSSQSTFTVPAMDSAEVELYFIPLQNGNSACMVNFYSGESSDLISCSGSGYGFDIPTTTLNFGNTGVGASDTLAAMAVNNGMISINIDSINFIGSDFSWQGGVTSVPAGDTACINIIFTPSSSGAVSDTAFIYSSAANYNVMLSGFGVGWTIEPDTLDFGINAMGAYDTLYLYISNFEAEDLSVDSMNWDDPAFIVQPQTFIVAQGETYMLPVVIHTFISGFHDTNLELYTNNGEVSIYLTGWIFFSSVEEQPLPREWVINPIHPNPFNEVLSLSFVLPETEELNVSILNILGEKIAVLIEGEIPGGYHQIGWNAGGCSSGLYFIVWEGKRGRIVQKAVLIK